MKTIHKYTLQLTEWQSIQMPAESKILTIQMQNGVPCMWVEVDTSLQSVTRKFLTVGTGHAINDEVVYLGTYQLYSGGLIMHVMELV